MQYETEDEATDYETDTNSKRTDKKRSGHHYGNFPNLGITVLASRFTKVTRKKGKHKKRAVVADTGSSSSLKMPQLFKPDEPDFSIDHEEV